MLSVRRRWLPLLALSVCCAACRTPPAGPTAVRLIDQLEPAQREQLASIDGIIANVLPDLRLEQRFALTIVPPQPVLTFAVGLRPSTEQTSVHFELLLAPATGPPVRLFERDLNGPGWSDVRIDLSDRDLTGASLIFRRRRVSGSTSADKGAWGNPMLIAGVPPARPSVILISLDTLRADYVGAYGRRQARTPALDRLAREGALFTAAASPSTWTLPSHAALFYGAHIPDTPVRLRATNQIKADTALPDRPLASILRDAGYLTAGFTGGGYLDWLYDFPRGFDHYYAYQQSELDPCAAARFDGPTVFAGATRWLRANHQHPFFLFIHTYDVHDRCPFGWKIGDVPELPPERLQQLLAYYDGLISNVDRRVADLLATLEALGRLDSTLIVVTSDHGEAFSEHGDRGHGCDMKPYEEIAQVPLRMRYPPKIVPGTRVAIPVSLIDVAPTVLALLDLPPESGMTGHILPGLGLPGAPREAPPVAVHCGDALAVRRGPFKLITSHEGRYPDELYDLRTDPREQRSQPDHAIRARLQADADEFWSRARDLSVTPNADPTPLDESTKERLRALGYDP